MYKCISLIIFILFSFIGDSFSKNDNPYSGTRRMKTHIICVPELNYFRVEALNIPDGNPSEFSELEEAPILRSKYHLIDERDSKPFICKLRDKTFKTKVTYEKDIAWQPTSANIKIWLDNFLLVDLDRFGGIIKALDYTEKVGGAYEKCNSAKNDCEVKYTMVATVNLDAENKIGCGQFRQVESLELMNKEYFKNKAKCNLYEPSDFVKKYLIKQ